MVPEDKKHVSNFQGGRNRSLCGSVDLEDGCLLGVIGGDYELCPCHPVSGKLIEGFRIDGWQDAISVLERASLAMSPFRMQHWDIAFTTRGPVILEMNFIGDIGSMQVNGPPGIFTEQFSTFLNTHKVWDSHR